MASNGPTAMVLSGGPHPFSDTTPVVVGLLEEIGYDSTVIEDPDEAARQLDLRPPQLWVCNTLRWRMLEGRYDDRRSDFAYSSTESVRSSFDSYVRGGGRLLAMHAAPICFDDWPGWGDIVGARWRWGTSSHPPLGPMKVQVVASHVLTEGVGDFEIFDEAYGHLDLAADLEPLAVSRWDDIDHPVLWEREVGAGRVVTCTLGHGRESLENPAHRRILVNAMELLGRDPEPVRPHHRTTQTPLEEQR